MNGNINYFKKNHIISSRKFCHTFRFIDDLMTVNNENLEKDIHNIYLAGLELKKEKEIDKNNNFLDFNVKIENSRF